MITPQRQEELNNQLKQFTVDQIDSMIKELMKEEKSNPPYKGNLHKVFSQIVLNIPTNKIFLDQTTSTGRFYVKLCEAILEKHIKKLPGEEVQFLKNSINRKTFNEDEQNQIRWLAASKFKARVEVSRQVEDATWAYIRGDIGYKEMRKRQRNG